MKRITLLVALLAIVMIGCSKSNPVAPSTTTPSRPILSRVVWLPAVIDTSARTMTIEATPTWISAARTIDTAYVTVDLSSPDSSYGARIILPPASGTWKWTVPIASADFFATRFTAYGFVAYHSATARYVDELTAAGAVYTVSK